jgi:Bacterial Ig-like domain (group 3)
MTVKGTNLAIGVNSVAASYSGDSKYGASTGSVTVTVTAPPATTTTIAAASPASIAQNLATQVTAVVKSATGSTLATGTVSFAIGNTSLGSATLTDSAGMASAVLSVAGSALKSGSNIITASYGGSSAFAASTGSAIVMVTAPVTATTTKVTASPASFAQSASTQLTVTVKAAAGTASPTGSVTFALGPGATAAPSSLGTAVLAGSGGVATGTLTVNGNSLAAGNLVMTATYSGSSGFSGSSGSATLSVSAATVSNVVAAATKTSSTQVGFPVKIQLQEEAGIATTITGFTVNGTSYTSAIVPFFGSAKLAAHGTLTGTMVIQWNPLPPTLVFVFTGEDASGKQWSQTVSLATKQVGDVRVESGPPVALKF